MTNDKQQELDFNSDNQQNPSLTADSVENHQREVDLLLQGNTSIVVLDECPQAMEFSLQEGRFNRDVN